MKQWLSQASHLATVIGVGIVLVTGLVGGMSYQTAHAVVADVQMEADLNTISIAVLQNNHEHVARELKEIKTDVKQIVSHLPPDRFWCKEDEC